MKPLAPLRAVGDDLALAQSLADAADAAAEMATRYFRRTGLEVRHKPDGSPVTEADRNIERLLRMRLALAWPDDVVVGEEFVTTGTGARRWFIDPVDGTKGFVAGRPGWRTLLAVEIEGVVTTGVVSAPALGMRWYARRVDPCRRRRKRGTAGPGIARSSYGPARPHGDGGLPPSAGTGRRCTSVPARHRHRRRATVEIGLR